jgi:hypothetical protein
MKSLTFVGMRRTASTAILIALEIDDEIADAPPVLRASFRQVKVQRDE